MIAKHAIRSLVRFDPRKASDAHELKLKGGGFTRQLGSRIVVVLGASCTGRYMTCYFFLSVLYCSAIVAPVTQVLYIVRRIGGMIITGMPGV